MPQITPQQALKTILETPAAPCPPVTAGLWDAAGHVLAEQRMASRWRPMETLCATPLLVTMLAMHSVTSGTYADALVREIKRRAELDSPYFREEA